MKHSDRTAEQVGLSHGNDGGVSETMMPLPNVIALSLALAVLPVADNSAKPTRSECIIGLKLDWSEVESDPDDVRNSLVRWPLASRVSAFAAMAISLEGDRMYFQFTRNCDEKQLMAAQLMSFWRDQGLELPNFDRIDDPIAPSTRTIDARGPYWRDGLPDEFRFDAPPDRSL